MTQKVTEYQTPEWRKPEFRKENAGFIAVRGKSGERVMVMGSEELGRSQAYMGTGHHPGGGVCQILEGGQKIRSGQRGRSV